jgi:hypothetical protein
MYNARSLSVQRQDDVCFMRSDLDVINNEFVLNFKNSIDVAGNGDDLYVCFRDINISANSNGGTTSFNYEQMDNRTLTEPVVVTWSVGCVTATNIGTWTLSLTTSSYAHLYIMPWLMCYYSNTFLWQQPMVVAAGLAAVSGVGGAGFTFTSGQFNGIPVGTGLTTWANFAAYTAAVTFKVDASYVTTQNALQGKVSGALRFLPYYYYSGFGTGSLIMSPYCEMQNGCSRVVEAKSEDLHTDQAKATRYLAYLDSVQQARYGKLLFQRPIDTIFGVLYVQYMWSARMNLPTGMAIYGLPTNSQPMIVTTQLTTSINSNQFIDLFAYTWGISVVPPDLKRREDEKERFETGGAFPLTDNFGLAGLSRQTGLVPTQDDVPSQVPLFALTQTVNKTLIEDDVLEENPVLSKNIILDCPLYVSTAPWRRIINPAQWSTYYDGDGTKLEYLSANMCRLILNDFYEADYTSDATYQARFTPTPTQIQTSVSQAYNPGTTNFTVAPMHFRQFINPCSISTPAQSQTGTCFERQTNRSYCAPGSTNAWTINTLAAAPNWFGQNVSPYLANNARYIRPLTSYFGILTPQPPTTLTTSSPPLIGTSPVSSANLATSAFPITNYVASENIYSPPLYLYYSGTNPWCFQIGVLHPALTYYDTTVVPNIDNEIFSDYCVGPNDLDEIICMYKEFQTEFANRWELNFLCYNTTTNLTTGFQGQTVFSNALYNGTAWTIPVGWSLVSPTAPNPFTYAAYATGQFLSNSDIGTGAAGTNTITYTGKNTGSWTINSTTGANVTFGSYAAGATVGVTTNPNFETLMTPGIFAAAQTANLALAGMTQMGGQFSGMCATVNAGILAPLFYQATSPSGTNYQISYVAMNFTDSPNLLPAMMSSFYWNIQTGGTGSANIIPIGSLPLFVNSTYTYNAYDITGGQTGDNNNYAGVPATNPFFTYTKPPLNDAGSIDNDCYNYTLLFTSSPSFEQRGSSMWGAFSDNVMSFGSFGDPEVTANTEQFLYRGMISPTFFYHRGNQTPSTNDNTYQLVSLYNGVSPTGYHLGPNSCPSDDRHNYGSAQSNLIFDMLKNFPGVTPPTQQGGYAQVAPGNIVTHPLNFLSSPSVPLATAVQLQPASSAQGLNQWLFRVNAQDVSQLDNPIVPTSFNTIQAEFQTRVNNWYTSRSTSTATTPTAVEFELLCAEVYPDPITGRRTVASGILQTVPTQNLATVFDLTGNILFGSQNSSLGYAYNVNATDPRYYKVIPESMHTTLSKLSLTIYAPSYIGSNFDANVSVQVFNGNIRFSRSAYVTADGESRRPGHERGERRIVPSK